MSRFIQKDDDLQLEMSFTTLFNGPVAVEKKHVAVLGFPYQGYIVRRAGGIPRYLPTKDELSKAIQFLPQDQFVDQMKEYYRRYHVGTEVRTKLVMVIFLGIWFFNPFNVIRT